MRATLFSIIELYSMVHIRLKTMLTLPIINNREREDKPLIDISLLEDVLSLARNVYIQSSISVSSFILITSQND
jgi:hypothetical protein